MTTNILLAGFGGQGILFAGKVLAYSGLAEDKQVSWLPSYGPEMRGGTANCSVCISDEPIGSPLVLSPDILVAMNTPSYDKFIDAVVPGGLAIVDSTLVDRKCARTDITVFYLPATGLANEKELQGLANIILVGKMIAERSFVSFESIDHAIDKCVPARKAHLVEANKRAIALGKSL
ncbi:MAG: 2-oxoacid:ferredoxin oxidoreductase subunit gamma [Provencibacterium sp.]|nr:2-oxoacid:ferredoxin oxidoreductase subunit gamma [Provencibacterium sp.]